MFQSCITEACVNKRGFSTVKIHWISYLISHMSFELESSLFQMKQLTLTVNCSTLWTTVRVLMLSVQSLVEINEQDDEPRTNPGRTRDELGTNLTNRDELDVPWNSSQLYYHLSHSERRHGTWTSHLLYSATMLQLTLAIVSSRSTILQFLYLSVITYHPL